MYVRDLHLEEGVGGSALGYCSFYLANSKVKNSYVCTYSSFDVLNDIKGLLLGGGVQSGWHLEKGNVVFLNYKSLVMFSSTF